MTKNTVNMLMALLVVSASLFACAPETGSTVEKTIFVASYTADCVGAAPQQCYLVREDPDDEWSLFYDQIEGFDYEEGYEYELRITEETIEDPPADASSIKWTLVEVVSKTEAPGAESAAGVEGVLWKLDSYVNSRGETAAVLAGTEITAEFSEGQVSGSAGCNSYFASYEVAGSSLTISPVGATMMACEPALNEQEAQYLGALESAASYAIVEGELQITNADGETVLTFSVVEPAPLTGTTWRLTGHNEGQGGFASVLAGTEITAEFKDGQASGSAGCNSYFASYEVAGESISIGPVGVTRMMCAEPAGVMEQESAYLAALESAATSGIRGASLEVLNADGVRTLSFAD